MSREPVPGDSQPDRDGRMPRVPWLLRSLGLADATSSERRATLWTAAMFCAALASTYVLRPLRDPFGVDQGFEPMPSCIR